jgi:hypothetical protein
LEVLSELVDELAGELRVGDLVDGTSDFLGVPRHAGLAAGVAGFERIAQLGVAGLVEAFVGLGQQPPGPV